MSTLRERTTATAVRKWLHGLLEVKAAIGKALDEPRAGAGGRHASKVKTTDWLCRVYNEINIPIFDCRVWLADHGEAGTTDQEGGVR